MSGYFNGLSSPSVTDSTTTLCASPRSKPAGQTRLPTFSISSRLSSLRIQVLQGMAEHVRIEMAALAGIDLQRRCAGGADAVGVAVGLLVALDHGDGHLLAQRFDGAHQQAGLAGAGAGDQVEREHAVMGEPAAIVGGMRVVDGEDVLLDAHHAFLAHAGCVGVGRALVEAQIAGMPSCSWPVWHSAVAVRMVVIVVVLMLVLMHAHARARACPMGRPPSGTGFDSCFTCSTAAYLAHD